MNYLNGVEKFLKRCMKKRVTFNEGVVVAFLITGFFGINTISNSAVVTDDSKNSIHIGDVANQGSKNILVGDVATNGTHSLIFAEKNDVPGNGGWHGSGDYRIVFGKWAASDSAVNYGIIFGNAAGHAVSGEYKFIFGEGAGFRNGGKYNFAFGNKAGNDAISNYNFAFGDEAGHNVKDIDGKPLGNNVALMKGAGANTTGGYNMAVGFQAGQITNGNYNFAFGPQAGKSVTGDENVAIGSHAGQNVTGAANYALGRNAGQNVSGLGNIAFGENAGVDVKGLGDSNHIKGNSNVAIGKLAGNKVISNQSLALGYNSGSYVGYRTWDSAKEEFDEAKKTEYIRPDETNPNSSIQSGAEHNTAVGANSGNWIAGQDNVAMGEESGNYIDGPNSGGAANIGIGSKTGNRIYGDSNTAIGKSAGSYMKGNNNLALGVNIANKIKGDNNIAIGVNNSNTTKDFIEKSNTISLGTEADATKTDAIAIGHGAKATGESSISIGTGNVISGANSGALGDPSYISGTGTYTIGNNNGTSADQIAADNSGIFGNDNKMSNAADNSRVIGNSNNVTHEKSFILGNNIITSAGNSVYLGDSSAIATTGTAGATGTVSSATVNGVTYSGFAGTTAAGAVTVGSAGLERRIMNVAAGEISKTSTDAINGSQLYALASTVANISASSASPIKYFSVKQTTDVANHKNDGATQEGAIAIGPNASATLKNSIVLGNGAKVNPEGGAGTNGIAIGTNARSHVMTNGNHEAIVTFGRDKANLAGGIAIGQDTHARIGNVELGNRDYRGQIGDFDFTTSDGKIGGTSITNNGKLDNWNVTTGVGTTAVGDNSYAMGNFQSINGAYNLISKAYDKSTASWAGNQIVRGQNALHNAGAAIQGFGATINGSLNTIEANENLTANLWSVLGGTPDHPANGLMYSGMASSIVGTANRINKSNGALIFGTGNEITNSYLTPNSPIIMDTLSMNTGFLGTLKLDPTISNSTIKELSDTLRKFSTDNRLASVGIMGGANKADYALFSNINGVGNTLTGKGGVTLSSYNTDFKRATANANIFSAFNSITGYENKGTNVTHSIITGSWNELENTEKNIVMGNKHVLKGSTT
ncbi:beta strand repeat-containing protein, partial [Fusobacterium gastrosuis]|uniref:beta strand repeat-containing protein n=1 Tax=Fusobacterium gastrosuis TaxID=1755100 RepID=UPI002A977F60|nr:hypothetical protein [Fusobacterium gastrosuis]